MDKNIKIYGTLVNHTTDNVIAYAKQILDQEFGDGTMQDVINRRVTALNYANGRTSISSPLIVNGDTQAYNITCRDVTGWQASFTQAAIGTDGLTVDGVSKFKDSATFDEGIEVFAGANIHGTIESNNIQLDEDIIAEGGHFHDVYANDVHTGALSPEDENGSINVRGNLIPSKNKSYTIGSSELKWSNIYSNDGTIGAIRVGSIEHADKNAMAIAVVGNLIPMTRYNYDAVGSTGNIGLQSAKWDNVYTKSVDTVTLNGTNVSNFFGTGNGSLDKIIRDTVGSMSITPDMSNYYTKSQIDSLIEDIDGGSYVLPNIISVDRINPKTSQSLALSGNVIPATNSTQLGTSSAFWNGYFDSITLNSAGYIQPVEQGGDIIFEGNVVSGHSKFDLGTSEYKWGNVYADNIEASTITLGREEDGGTSYYGQLSFNGGNLTIGGSGVDTIQFDCDTLEFGDIDVLSKFQELQDEIDALREQIASQQYIINYDSSSLTVGDISDIAKFVEYMVKQPSEESWTGKKYNIMENGGVSVVRGSSIKVKVSFNAVQTDPQGIIFTDIATGAVDTAVDIFPEVGEEGVYTYTLNNISSNYTISYQS